MKKYCFLFDLDGTLVLTGGAGLRAFDQAFKDIFETEGRIKIASPAGKTDPAILESVCRHYLGRPPTADEEKRFFDRYLGQLREELVEAPGYEIMPGIKELLDRLHGDARCFLGLGTGNIRKGAEIKLEKAGLWRYFRFGGFGSDARIRSELLEIGRSRGKSYLADGEDFTETFVLGDTPHDIEAGKAIHAVTVGIATGPFSVKDLQVAGADLCYPDLSDFDPFLSRIGLI